MDSDLGKRSTQMSNIYVYTVSDSGMLSVVDRYDDVPNLSYVLDMMQYWYGDVDGRIVEHSHDDLRGWPTPSVTWYAREGSGIILFGLGVAEGDSRA